MLALWWWRWQHSKLTDYKCIFILIVLDPWLKLCYYEEHDWEKEYIDKAKETVSRIYHSQYAPMDNLHQEIDDDDNDLIAHIYKKRQIEGQSEFELYLKVPCAPQKADVLQWWKVSWNTVFWFLF